jgi:hypothetical protein
MSGGLDWLLIGLAALISGVFNLSVALKQFRTISKDLIFFEPVRSVGFWVWVGVQMALPAIAFLLWVTDFFESQPDIEFMLFLEAVGVGVGFTAFLNARTETGFLTIDIQSMYEGLSRFGFELIAKRETLRTSRFWRALEIELKKPYITLDQGLQYLQAYFEGDISLKLPERLAEQEKLLMTVDQALKLDAHHIEEKIDLISSLLRNVRQDDIIRLLKDFRCNDGFLRDTIPHRFYQKRK